MLNIEVLSSESALERLVPEWDALEARLPLRVPFRSSAWNILWWKHFRESGAWVRDELLSYSLRETDGRLVAVAPMMLTRRPGGLFPIVREMQFFGADPNITEMRGLICADEDQPRVIEILKQEFEARRSDWDWIQWCGIHALGQGSLDFGKRIRWHRPTLDFCLALPSSWDEFRSGLSRNIKESLRKCYNSLKRDGHDFCFHVVSQPERVAAALERFFELHAERSKLESDAPHPNVFARPASRAFLLAYSHHLAQRNALRVFQLEIAGCIVATRIGFELGDALFLYYSGYMPDWGRYSVMTTVVAESIRWAIDRKLRMVNLSTGSDVSKTRWNPVEVKYANGLQVTSALPGQWRFKAHQFLRQQSNFDQPVGRLLRSVRRKS